MTSEPTHKPFQASASVRRLDGRLYPAHADHWDDEIFRERIRCHLGSTTRVLDVGAGAGFVRQMNFRGLAARVVGVDPDECVRRNPHLDESHVASGEHLPFADEEFDVAFADNVLEHLEEPDRVFAEVFRVLRPGGTFLVKTPNRWHYMPLVASVTPLWFHRRVNQLRGRAPEHTFPTRYRVNTRPALERVARRSGFDVRRIDRVEGRPEYLRIAAPLYVLGWLYERAVNRTAWLEPFRILLIGELRKPTGPTDSRDRKVG